MPRPALSYWERDILSISDFAIIGGGILGLWTAIELKQKHPKSIITTYERDIIGLGATTRNAGFACFGSLTELIAQEDKIGTNQMLQQVEKRWKGIQKIKALHNKYNLNYQEYGGYELIKEAKVDIDTIRHYNELLSPILGPSCFQILDDQISNFGFANIQQIIYNPLEGQIHSGKLMLALQKKCAELDIQICYGAELKSYQSGTKISLELNTIMGSIEATTNQLIFCTNAFAPTQLVDQINPGRGQVLVTKPISQLQFKGCFHLQEGYYYFRNLDDSRVLFGGGRQLDFETETTTEFMSTDKILDDLKHKLATIILPHQEFDIDYAWSGIMAFHGSHLPRIQQIDTNIIYAMNCNGMGVCQSPMTAEEIAKQL